MQFAQFQPAFARSCIPPLSEEQGKHPALEKARDFSVEVIERLVEELHASFKAGDAVRAVGLSGSLGRLEASPHADADVIVVVQDGLPADSPEIRSAMDAIWQALGQLEIEPPQPDGIYRQPISAAELCDPQRRGVIEERIDVFGKRMQLLLDSQGVYGGERFERLLREILKWYAVDRSAAIHPWWAYLTDDLLRYFRSYRAATRWNLSAQEGGWWTRNVKFAHSRTLMCAGLVCLLGECSRRQSDPLDWLAAHLCLTPLERVGLTYRASGEPGFARLAEWYSRFLAAMEDAHLRRLLAEASPRDAADLPDEPAPEIAALVQNGADFRRELTRLLRSQKNRWYAGFVDQLML